MINSNIQYNKCRNSQLNTISKKSYACEVDCKLGLSKISTCALLDLIPDIKDSL